MLGGDVPWEGSSRRLVSLQAPCHVKSTCVLGAKARPSCLRERVSPSLRVSSAAWQRESGRSRTRAAGAPHVSGSSRSSFGVGGARAARQSSVENS